MNTREPVSFVLFGATGDLAQRKIMPALCALYIKGGLPEGSQIIAFSRRPWGDAEYRAFIQPSLVAFTAPQVEDFLGHVHYTQGTFDDPESFTALKERVTKSAVVAHLAIQPEFYEPVVRRLGEAKIGGRLLIEKPFGHNYASAESLERSLEKHFPSEAIFRVDHYLGKEGLDALLVRRRADAAFETGLGSGSVASVTVRLLETLDVEGRGEFYDAAGALKDVGQNHLLMMLATLLMDLPEKVSEIPHARTSVVESLTPKVSVQGGIAGVRGQYEGYHSDSEVPEGSETETYFKVELRSSLPRWQGVPLILEAGKALKEKKSEVEISYKDGSRAAFSMDPEGAHDAYEHVIEAGLRGEAARFASAEEVFAAWRFIEPLAASLRATPLRQYEKGSDGAGRFL